MSEQTFSAAYIAGIKEGRSTYTRFLADGILTQDHVATHLATLLNLHRAFSGDMKEFTSGEIDFWKGKLQSIPN